MATSHKQVRIKRVEGTVMPVNSYIDEVVEPGTAVQLAGGDGEPCDR